ncbi:hypothetical protein [Neisseria dumasiana]|uniref:Uracil-DNA glycosylase-like domain-containing protein n=1 Tax=Neisseria dumasiana TaxID=1931275 RepID=A0A1X3DDZ0_9NEIS|nr:hypothetical protein [Neisseria dumasiana]OSI18148.1 hypothetical protein BV912_10255 [Neisseria dumasiana]
MDELNLANSIFPDFNDQNGLMICGYEWGWSKADEAAYEQGEYTLPEEKVEHTFANKALYYGERAKTWRYDNAIKTWFDLWGHPLNEQGLGGAFEKSLLQTNWANTQDRAVNDYEKFLSPEQVNNFMHHLKTLRPKVIFFMGSKLLNYLNRPEVLPKFKQIMGEEIEPLHYEQKPFEGTRFRVGFQGFEHCQVVCLPHPSASRGLSYGYIELFRPEMNKILADYKAARGF